MCKNTQQTQTWAMSNFVHGLTRWQVPALWQGPAKSTAARWDFSIESQLSLRRCFFLIKVQITSGSYTWSYNIPRRKSGSRKSWSWVHYVMLGHSAASWLNICRGAGTSSLATTDWMLVFIISTLSRKSPLQARLIRNQCPLDSTSVLLKIFCVLVTCLNTRFLHRECHLILPLIIL